MNFYLDFEAAQFSEEIISIGCVAENGETFRQLVWPKEFRHITNFITDLTGLTRDMVKEEGVNPDEAFLRFRKFVWEQSGGEVPAYFCYGDSDRGFIAKTMKNMNDFEAIIFASSVMGLLTDYAKEVKKYLSVEGIALKKLVMLVRHDENVIQNHDALDDALMLKECYGKLPSLTPNKEELATVMAIPRSKPKKTPLDFGEELPRIPGDQVFSGPVDEKMRTHLNYLRNTEWNNVSRDNCLGDTDAEHAEVILTDVYAGDKKYFSSPLAAALFLNMKVRSNKSTKKVEVLIQTARDMFQNPNNFCKYRCELIRKDV